MCLTSLEEGHALKRPVVQLSHQMMRGMSLPCVLCTSATAGHSSQLPTLLYGSLGKHQVQHPCSRTWGPRTGCSPSSCPMGTQSCLLVSETQSAFAWALDSGSLLKASQIPSFSPGLACLDGHLAEASPSLPSWGEEARGTFQHFSLG